MTFLRSTNAPALDPSSSTVPGRIRTNGPTRTSLPIVESRTTANVTSLRSPTRESTIRVDGPIDASAPIRVSPSRNVIGRITVSRPIVTSTSMYVAFGSTIVTPLSMCVALIRSRTTRSTAASPPREFTPNVPPVSTGTTDTRSPLSIRIGSTSFR